jgi:hypothetical protein
MPLMACGLASFSMAGSWRRKLGGGSEAWLANLGAIMAWPSAYRESQPWRKLWHQWRKPHAAVIFGVS